MRPPLTHRLRPGHWMALDWAAALVIAVVLAFDLRSAVSAAGPSGLLVCLLAGLVLSVPVALRRRAPLLTFTAAVLLALAVTAVIAVTNHEASVSGGAVLPRAAPVGAAAVWDDVPGLLLPAAYVLYLVAAHYRRRTALTALAVALGLIVAEAAFEHSAQPGGQGAAVSLAFVVIVCWIVGYTVGQRRAYGAALRDQAASSAVTEERLRIARELHDVVAHSMTVIAVQAGYGKHVIDAQPAQAEEALGAIQATSREALAEMRRMLGVLRQSGPAPYGKTSEPGTDGAVQSLADMMTAGSGPADGAAAGRPGVGGGAARRGSPGRGGTEAAPLAPAPGLADLDRLIGRIANAGVKVELEVRGERPDLAPGIDLAAFRIVQEALTNVVKHSGAPRCKVTVSYLEDELAVEITDEGRGSPVPATAGGAGAEPAGGHGLIGMRERVSLYGGLLAAGPLPEHGFGVTARLPLRGGAR
jgi:signal transduction histidine kinase